ncbi:MAG TPA: hypothetical protein ENJ82_12370, partial [Bacteroidetes bacterium]|nr:hypothetical protein [Bacteroidota bacterium]
MQALKTFLTLLLAFGLSATAWSQNGLNNKSLKNQVIDRGNGEAPSFTAAQPKAANHALGTKPGYTDENLKKYAATITAQDLEAHLSFLASDACEGRETGRHGQKVAAQYLASQFQKIGLKPGNNGSWVQEFELEEVEIRKIDLTFDGKTIYKTGKDFAYLNMAAMAESFTAPLVFAGFGISTEKYDNFQGLSLQGKAVLVLNGEPKVNEKYVLSGSEKHSKWAETRAKAKALKEKGAKAVIIAMSDADYKRISNNPWLRHKMTGSSLKLKYIVDRDGGNMPILLIPERIANVLIKKSKKQCAELRNTLNTSGKVSQIDFKKNKCQVISDASRKITVAENVLGFMEGSDKKDEVVVLTAHYDHLGIKDGEI